MLIKIFPVLILLLVMPRDSIPQCPPDTLVLLQCNHTTSWVGTTSPSDSPKCANSTNSSQCCRCGQEDYLACPSIDSALSYVNSVVKVQGIIGFQLTLGRSATATNLTLSEFHPIQGFDNVAFVGKGVLMINYDKGAGITFSATTSVTLQSISWYGRGIIATATSDGAQYLSTKGLTFVNCFQVVMKDVHFERFNSSAVFFDVGPTSNSECVFEVCSMTTLNARVKFQYEIDHCSFVDNGNQSSNGGAVQISFRTSHASSVTIVNTTFVSNSAQSGGAISYQSPSLDQLDNCVHFMLSIQDCVFVKNSASNYGGGLFIANNEGFFDNCTFENNSAVVGGAIYYSSLDYTSLCHKLESKMNVTFQSCTWIKNKAQGSAAIYFEMMSKTKNAHVVFVNSTFTNNMVNGLFFFGQSACIIYLSSLSAMFDSTLASYNEGTALCLDTSSIIFRGHNSFSNNHGFHGGAVYIYASSGMTLREGQVVEFANNTALYGGAIYQNLILPKADSCIFNFPNRLSDNDTHVRFIYNTAFVSGHSVYSVTAPQACQTTFLSPQISFTPNDSFQLSSSAKTIELYGSIYRMNGEQVINVTLGVNILFNASVLDFWGRSTTISITPYLQDVHNQNTPLSIVGSPSFTIKSGLNTPDLSIKGPQICSNECLSPYYLVLIASNVQGKIRLYMKPCSLGLHYNDSTNTCTCDTREELVCSGKTTTVCIKMNYWIGNISGTQVIAPCSSGLCNTTFGACKDCPGHSGYCELNGTSPNCVGNHSGLVCRECSDGYTPGFLSIRCFDNSTCHAMNAFYLVAIDLVFLASSLCLFIVILKLDYRIGSGYLLGVFYYYSIVMYLVPPNAVEEAMLVTIAVLQQITQLNPRLLSYIDLCYHKNNNAIVEYAFCYLNPLILAVFIFSVIRLSKCCPRFVLFSDSTMVRAICLLAIASFATFTEISFNILMPIHLEGINETRVNIQPTVLYLNKEPHLLLFILAVIFIVFAILPFTLLLLTAPFVIRYINLNRIKPFLDEFQGCFKDKLRWMAGFYLICRIVYLALLTLPFAGNKNIQYGVQFLSVIILLIHFFLQPYKSRFLNVVDFVILTDVMILVFLFDQTTGIVYAPTKKDTENLAYVLVLLPIIYVLFLALLAIASKISRKYASKNNWFLQNLKMPNTGNTEVNSNATLNQSCESHHFREPLLEVMDSTEQTPLIPGGSGRSTSIQYDSFRREPSTSVVRSSTNSTGSQTIIERPTGFITQSAMFENS